MKTAAEKAKAQMNRVIKVRAWDEDLKAMLNGDDIESLRMPPPPDSESADEGPYRYIARLSYGKLFVAYYKNGDWRECEIMQFTGLSDRHGKDIYEGDILEVDDGDEWQLGKAAVVYEGCRFGYKLDIGMELINGRIEKVIGNIYENPELLAG